MDEKEIKRFIEENGDQILGLNDSYKFEYTYCNEDILLLASLDSGEAYKTQIPEAATISELLKEFGENNIIYLELR